MRGLDKKLYTCLLCCSICKSPQGALRLPYDGVPGHLKLIGHCRADVACATPVLQVLAAEPKKEAMVPYIKVFQTLLRCDFSASKALHPLCSLQKT